MARKKEKIVETVVKTEKRHHKQKRSKRPKSKKVRAGRRAMVRTLPQITANAWQSHQFLHSAFAPFDFANNSFQGIPDMKTDRILTNNAYTEFNVLIPAGTDRYFLFAPTPGIACYSSTLADPGAVWYPTIMPSELDLTTALTPFAKFNQYRFGALVFEFTYTGADLNAAGRLSAINCDLEMVDTVNPTSGVVSKMINGLPTQNFNGLNQADMYDNHAKHGFYAVCTNRTANFEWNETLMGDQTGVGWTLGTNGFGSFYNTPINLSVNPPTFQPPLFVSRGFDKSMSSKLVRISATSDLAFSVKVYHAQELRLIPNLTLSQYTHVSPAYSPSQLQMYVDMAAALSIGYTRAENPNFWQVLRGLITKVSGALSFVPGPVGMIASGVNQIAR